jgi:hypothetical protein
MAKLVLAIIAVTLIIFVVPVAVYGITQAMIGAEIPQGASPVMFLAGVFVGKAGTAIAFCAIFYLARKALTGQWLVYAAIWWVMFAFGEVAQLFEASYGWKEALAGLISEAIYFPAAAWLVDWMWNERTVTSE